jgi:hypothetical protein
MRAFFSRERNDQFLITDGMRRPVSGRDAVRSQVIDVLKAQIKGDRQ